MGLAWMLGPWRASLQAILPELHSHQINGLAEGSLAMIAAAHCQLSRMAFGGLRPVAIPSCERRWQRLVANARIDVDRVAQAWARSTLADAGAVTLILDETPQANAMRVMKLCRQTHGRAVPLVWSTYRPDALPMRQDQVVLNLLLRAARAPPDGAKPTLLADRGLSWPAVLDFCEQHGWHYGLRVQGHTRARFQDGQQVAVAGLVPTPGAFWRGNVHVFKKAGWRRTNLVAHWAPGFKDPWLLITDLPASRLRCRQYGKRMHVEQCFRDEKSHGFHWNQSRIRDPAHAHRLLLLMALAMRLPIALGLHLIKTGQRPQFERRDRRTLSVFQLGLRGLLSSSSPLRSLPRFKSIGS